MYVLINFNLNNTKIFVFVKLNAVFQKLPKDTNAYLFEIKRYKARDLKFLPTVLKIQRSEVIMQTIVKNSIINNSNGSLNNETPIEQKIFLLNASRIGRMFDLVVGNERVKSSNLVALMLKQNLKPDEEILGPRSRARRLILDVTQENQDFFARSTHKEPLSINYLQASCFVNIVKRLIHSVP